MGANISPENPVMAPPSARSPRSNLFALAALAVVTLTAAGACAKTDQPPDSAAMASTPPVASAATGDSMAAMPGMGAGATHDMANMTGDPDRDFLRMMSDHHKGLIVMARMTKDRKEGTSVADARKLDAVQDAELNRMVTILEKDFKDSYAPRVMAEHQAMADVLKAKTGKEYDRTFYQNIIEHHAQAVKMVDEYLPKAKNTTIRQMAEKMRADQTQEMADFQQRIAKLGA